MVAKEKKAQARINIYDEGGSYRTIGPQVDGEELWTWSTTSSSTFTTQNLEGMDKTTRAQLNRIRSRIYAIKHRRSKLCSTFAPKLSHPWQQITTSQLWAWAKLNVLQRCKSAMKLKRRNQRMDTSLCHTEFVFNKKHSNGFIVSFAHFVFDRSVTSTCKQDSIALVDLARDLLERAFYCTVSIFLASWLLPD